MRDVARVLPMPVEPDAVHTLRVWHCKYRTLAPIAAMRNLTGLDIATYPDDSLDVLREVRTLRYLSVMHLPRVSDLRALSDLPELMTLRLRTLPSWDASSKKTRVASLTPLEDLPNLKHLELFSVTPDDDSLLALADHPGLMSVRLQ